MGHFVKTGFIKKGEGVKINVYKNKLIQILKHFFLYLFVGGTVTMARVSLRGGGRQGGH